MCKFISLLMLCIFQNPATTGLASCKQRKRGPPGWVVLFLFAEHKGLSMLLPMNTIAQISRPSR